jgi:pimeloyl-ACP methyl ester carboxylesterase
MSEVMPGVLLEPHAEVRGVEIAPAEVGRSAAPGPVDLTVPVDGGRDGAWVQVPPCAGRKGVTLDGRAVPTQPGPAVFQVQAGQHEVGISIEVSKYERRIACGEPVRVGTATTTVEGLGVLSFPTPYGPAGGGHAVVYVPPGHDLARPAALLVGLHPWNGTMWTYAAYSELLAGARARDVVLLMPSGLGNSLYTADAEDEAMRAIDALESVVAIDPQRVSIWGASMGGAGATTVGFHHPDRFASITSFFGDSKYDLTTYVRGLLHDERGAHQVNALDVVDNARSVPVLLIHGEDDVTSPIRQSQMLADGMRAHGFRSEIARIAGLGHAGTLVARNLSTVIDRAATASAPLAPARVTYRSVRPWDTGAYGVHLRRASPEGDAFVDVELREGAVHVRLADGVRELVLDPGALGADAARPPAIVNDTGHALGARWAAGAP